ncbi:MAG: XRE family transcriptional regulator, partial [Pseudomonadota bacterium]
DSLYFDARLGHAYISVSRQLARTIGVTTSESQQMRSAQALPAAVSGKVKERRAVAAPGAKAVSGKRAGTAAKRAVKIKR